MYTYSIFVARSFIATYIIIIGIKPATVPLDLERFLTTSGAYRLPIPY